MVIQDVDRKMKFYMIIKKKRETVMFYWDVCIVCCSTTEYKKEIQH